MAYTPDARPWSFLEKLLFRFLFLLFSLFILIFNNGAYPFFDLVMDWPTELLHRFVPWVGKHVLHLPYEITEFTNGSGDTTYDYICLLLVFVLSIAGCLIWTIADRRRHSYNKLYYWLTVAVRFYVGLMLFSYGFIKIYKLQFPSPTLHRLTQPYGNSSPMGLAWTFLGFSRAYNVFMGIAEIAALLLLFRRTVAVGAIICLMTTANVMAVNYCYDVPVKIVSTALVVLTLFLLSPNIKRLFGFFFRHQTTDLKIIGIPPLRPKWLRYILRSVKVLLGIYLLYFVYDIVTTDDSYGDYAPKPPLFGVYNVLSYHVLHPKDSVLPDIGADTRWRQLVVDWPEFARARLVADTSYDYTFKPDTLKKEIRLCLGDDTAHMSVLRYELKQDSLLLQGKLMDDSVRIRLKRFDRFRLTTRGFHWINEYPYNK